MKFIAKINYSPDSPTMSDHIYPRKVLEAAITNANERTKSGKMLGYFESGVLSTVAVKVNELKLEEHDFIIEGETLDTPFGKMLEHLMRANQFPTFSTSGIARLEGKIVTDFLINNVIIVKPE